MTFKLESDGVHFYCSSPEVARRLIERGARIVDPSRAVDRRRALRLQKTEEGPRPADPRVPRS